MTEIQWNPLASFPQPTSDEAPLRLEQILPRVLAAIDGMTVVAGATEDEITKEIFRAGCALTAVALAWMSPDERSRCYVEMTHSIADSLERREMKRRRGFKSWATNTPEGSNGRPN